MPASGSAARLQIQIRDDNDEFAHQARIVPRMVQFTLEPPIPTSNLIRGYSDSELRIGEQRITRSCIVTADRH